MRVTLLFLLALMLWSISPPPAHGQDGTYVIRSVEYTITGITYPIALENRIGTLEGRTFTTREHLERTINLYRDELNNLRQFQSVDLQYRIATEGTKNAVFVKITIVDSNNFIILPYLRYNTSDGLYLSARIRDNNFLGTLERLSLDTSAELQDGINKGSVNFEPQLTIPFQLADLNWYWRSALELAITFSGDIEGSFDNTVAVKIPLHDQVWEASYLQRFDFSSATTASDALLLGSALTFKSKLDTAIDIGFMNPLTYNPLFFVDIDYWFTDIADGTIRPLQFGYNHAISSGRINWKGNLREGLTATIQHNTSFAVYHPEVSVSLAVLLQGHLMLGIVGLSTRIGGEYYIPTSSTDHHLQDDFGTRVRGVHNNSLQGNALFYLNSDFTITGFRNANFIEGHANLFVDLALGTNVAEKIDIENDLRLGVGVEALAFFVQARSIIARISVGFDPLISIRTRQLIGNGNYEISIGIGHHY